MISKHVWAAGLVAATFLMMSGEIRSCFGQAGHGTPLLTFPEHFPAIRGSSYMYRYSTSRGERILYRVDVGAPTQPRGSRSL
jgi:hypothetical protein